MLMNQESKNNSILAPQAQLALAQLGQRVRAYRLARNWTIAQTAERLFCSPNTYRALEAGKSSVGLGLLVDTLWLFGRLDDLTALLPLGEWVVENRRVRRATGGQTAISDAERNF